MILRDYKGTPILDLPFNVALGELNKVTTEHKFGRLIGLAAPVRTIWTGDTLYTYPLSGDQHYIASTYAGDVSSGAGIKAVKVDYLDTNWDMQTEIHCLNGNTPVAVGGANFLRLHRMRYLSNVKVGGCVKDVNSGQLWLGTSDFTTGVPTVKHGHIPILKQQTYQSFYSVPRGYQLLMYDLSQTVNEGKSSNIELFIRDTGEDFTSLGFPDLGNPPQGKMSYDIFQTTFVQQFKVAEQVTEMSDIEFRATGSVGGDVNLSVDYSFLLVGSGYNESQ